MPLGKGKFWTYNYNARLRTGVEKLAVTGPTAISGHQGFILEGPMGRCAMAWKGVDLVASELAGVWYDPPLLLIRDGVRDGKGELSGKAIIAGQSFRYQGTWTQEPIKHQLGTRKLSAIKVERELTFDANTLKTTTVFVPGIGIVRQEEKWNGEFRALLNYVTGP
jgi:hypothetical protein